MVGRLQDGKLRSSGPESLFLFAVPEGEEARATLLWRSLCSIGLVLFLVGSLVAILWAAFFR